MFNNSAFGGATKRFTNLFYYLNKQNPGYFYYIINGHLFRQIKEVYRNIDMSDIYVIDLAENEDSLHEYGNTPRHYKDHVTDPMETDKSVSGFRKVFWFYKNRFRQKKLFRRIEHFREKNNIKVLHGVYGGAVPLMFYFNKHPRNAAVVFSDMDSWFTDVLTDIKKLWYRKYFSFNDVLENADIVDFLSPYILEGVRMRGIKIDDDRAEITACSFADYEKCSVGNKTNFEIAFASRLEPDKNPMIFLEAAKIIHSEFPDIKFHLMGEGSLVNEINSFIKINNLANTVNFIFHSNPPDIFSGTSVFVSLQSGTNYPSQSVLEAMACGNAVVASNTGDTGLLINDSNGIMTEMNTGSVVKALRKLILNPERARELGITGREYVLKNHTVEKAADYYLKLYNKAFHKVFGGNN